MTTTENTSRPRLLIEDWLPAQAIGVECMRERGSASALAPHTYLHVWWARRPLTVSRAAVLASLLPADFDHATFERLLGFYATSKTIIANDDRVNLARLVGGARIANPHGKRAFSAPIPQKDAEDAIERMSGLWDELPTTIDPMAGGGSIPLEAARIGVHSLANEYNPVACTVLEATVDYPIRFGAQLGDKARVWSQKWRERFVERMSPFYPSDNLVPTYTYIYARTVPCPDTGFPTPLCPDWSLLKQDGKQVVAEPKPNQGNGTWTVSIREVGKAAGQMRQPPTPTYKGGKGISLFSGNVIPADYIKAMAQQGKMGSALYAVATKATSKLVFRPAEKHDNDALGAAERELARVRSDWERNSVIPTELFPEITSDPRPRVYGMPRWADMFSARQLLSLGVLVEELNRLRPEILMTEVEELGEAIVSLLALVVDKVANHDCMFSKWENTRGVIKGKFDRHDYAFRTTYAELSPCVNGGGLAWTIDNVIEAFEKIAALPRSKDSRIVTITQGSATNLPFLEDKSVTAVVVDPPYADNVQYSELADFFYVWLKRTQGHRRPEWFSTYLCDHDEEAVVNVSRFRNAETTPAQARIEANCLYQKLMTETFREAHRILRDDGPLTVMFTHKKQEAWAALFDSLVEAGFTITATWPVQTESQHSLHQAEKNAAQSTVILVARKRLSSSGIGYLNEAMRNEITNAARNSAARLKGEGLNAVDQLVGAFGPAMEVFTRYKDVRTDTGERVGVAEAIDLAAKAVSDWRIEQIARLGLDGVDPESRFALLYWDVLGAAEVSFDSAKLLGNAVGMDIDRLKETGLIRATGEKVTFLTAKERRREKAVRTEQEQLNLFGAIGGSKRRKSSRTINPNDEYFSSAIDMCQALALKYAETGSDQAGIGAARGTALQQGWGRDSECAQLMSALVNAAPSGVRFPGKGTAKTAADDYPEFRAWHTLLKPVFGIDPPEWKKPVIDQQAMAYEEPDIEDPGEADDETEDAE